MECLEFICRVLANDRARLGSYSPQFSYYQRLAHRAMYDFQFQRIVFEHTSKHGTFAGL